jgi:hypothetical protein
MKACSCIVHCGLGSLQDCMQWPNVKQISAPSCSPEILFNTNDEMALEANSLMRTVSRAA